MSKLETLHSSPFEPENGYTLPIKQMPFEERKHLLTNLLTQEHDLDIYAGPVGNPDEQLLSVRGMKELRKAPTIIREFFIDFYASAAESYEALRIVKYPPSIEAVAENLIAEAEDIFKANNS